MSNAPEIQTSPRTKGKRLSPLIVVLPIFGIIFPAAAFYGFVVLPDRQMQMRKQVLFKAGFQYHEFHSVHSRPPLSLDELLQAEPSGLYALNNPRDLSTFASRVRGGEVTVLWGSKLMNDGDANDKYLLAYESQTPEQGGLVLMAGCTVKEMSATSFASLPKLPMITTDAKEEPSIP